MNEHPGDMALPPKATLPKPRGRAYYQANFNKQPKQGLGQDGSAVAHMWRTLANPDAPL